MCSNLGKVLLSFSHHTKALTVESDPFLSRQNSTRTSRREERDVYNKLHSRWNLKQKKTAEIRWIRDQKSCDNLPPPMRPHNITTGGVKWRPKQRSQQLTRTHTHWKRRQGQGGRERERERDQTSTTTLVLTGGATVDDLLWRMLLFGPPTTLLSIVCI